MLVQCCWFTNKLSHIVVFGLDLPTKLSDSADLASSYTYSAHTSKILTMTRASLKPKGTEEEGQKTSREDEKLRNNDTPERGEEMDHETVTPNSEDAVRNEKRKNGSTCTADGVTPDSEHIIVTNEKDTIDRDIKMDT